jgi:hypothetical protein
MFFIGTRESIVEVAPQTRGPTLISVDFIFKFRKAFQRFRMPIFNE